MLLEGKPFEGKKNEDLDEGGWMTLNWTSRIWMYKDEEQDLWNRAGICYEKIQGQT
jgi:hypothetical protein